MNPSAAAIQDETEKRGPLKARFYRRDVNGESRIYCRVVVSPLSVWDQPLRDADKQQWAKEWEEFEQHEELISLRKQVAQSGDERRGPGRPRKAVEG